jgi:hypothetical protein
MTPEPRGWPSPTELAGLPAAMRPQRMRGLAAIGCGVAAGDPRRPVAQLPAWSTAAEPQVGLGW